MTLGDDVAQLVIDQVAEAQAEQPDLELALEYTGAMIVRGTIRFCIDHDGHAYRDAYQVQIGIPPDYPESVPTAKETAEAIPHDLRVMSCIRPENVTFGETRICA